jgi:hypothetical protein
MPILANSYSFVHLLGKPLILILLAISLEQYETSPFPVLFCLAIRLLYQHYVKNSLWKQFIHLAFIIEQELS